MVSTTRSTGAAGTVDGPEAVTTTDPAAPRVSTARMPVSADRRHGGVEVGGAEQRA